MFLGLSSSFGQGLRDKKDGTLNPDAFLTCEKEHVPQSFGLRGRGRGWDELGEWH